MLCSVENIVWWFLSYIINYMGFRVKDVIGGEMIT